MCFYKEEIHLTWMSGNNQRRNVRLVPLPNPMVNAGPGLAHLPYQSRGGPTTTTTVIRPSPGTTTEVIIRPALVDGQPGKTQIIRFPPPGDFQNLQVQQVQSPNVAQSQNVVQTRNRDKSPNPVQSIPGAPPPLQAYPVTTFSGFPADGARPVPLPSKSPPPISPYNFQSQRFPLPGLQNPGQSAPPRLNSEGGGDPLVLDSLELLTIDLDTTDPMASALQKTLFGLQMLAEGGLVTNSSVGMSPFDILVDTEHIFIEPANTGEFSDASFTTQNKFNLMDSYGNRLFYAFEKRKPGGQGGCCTVDTPLNLAIVAAHGVECMALSGNTRMVTLRESVAGVCGYVQELTTHCPSTSTAYDIKDKQGRLCFKILQEQSSSHTEYELYGVDMIKIGHVGKFWGHLPDSAVDMSHSYGISIPRDMNTEEKALILGALIPIYWKYFVDKSRETRLAWNAWWCLCCWILIFILVIFGISVLAAYIIRH